MFETIFLLVMAFVGMVTTSVGVLVISFVIRDAISRRHKPPV
jgi:hypothetical protein